MEVALKYLFRRRQRQSRHEGSDPAPGWSTSRAGETVGAQWADGPTGLAVADVTTISGPKMPTEEEVGGTEAVRPTGAMAALVDAHTLQYRANDRSSQSARGTERVIFTRLGSTRAFRAC